MQNRPKSYYNLPNWISAKNKDGRWVKGCIVYAVGNNFWLYDKDDTKAPGIDPKTIKYHFDELKNYVS